MYLTHSYGPPYKGKFHPRLVRAFINYCGIKNGLVFDPFVGSGTTSIESTLMGLDSIGIDINPLCILSTNAKIIALYMDPDELLKTIEKFLERAKYIVKTDKGQKGTKSLLEFSDSYQLPKVKDLEPTFKSQLSKIFESKVSEIEKAAKIKYLIDDMFDHEIRDFFLCALAKIISKLSKKKSKADILKMLTEELQEMWKMVLVFKQFKEKLGIEIGESKNYVADARKIPKEVIGDEEADIIVTSPSYSTAIDYVKNDLPQLVALQLTDPEDCLLYTSPSPRD